MFRGEEKMEEASAETIVGADVTVKGNLKSPSNIAVNGTVKGKINTKADVIIGEQALVEGSIIAGKITVSGTIQGNVEGKEGIEITPSGKIFGDMATTNLVIQSGAVFVGKSAMNEQGREEAEEEVEVPEEETEDAEMKEKEEVAQ